MSEAENDIHTPDQEAEKVEDASSDGATKGSRTRRSNSKRISMLERAAQEGEALLKELGYKEETPDEGRRRTRSATRGPIATPPPNKRQKRTSSKTNSTPATPPPPQPKGRKGRRKVQVDETCETPNGTTDSVKSDDGNEIEDDDPTAETVQDEKMDVDAEKADGGSQEDQASSLESCKEQTSPKKETNSSSQTQVSNGDVKSEEKASAPESLPAKESESVHASNDKKSEEKVDAKKEDVKSSSDMTVASHAANTKPVVPSSVSLKPESVSQPNTPAVKPTPVQSDSPATESAIQTTVICPPKVSSPASNEKGSEAVSSSPSATASSPSVTPSGNTSHTPTIPTPIASSQTPTASPTAHATLPESVCGATPVFSSVLHPVLPQSEVSSKQD